MESDRILVERCDGVSILTFNRPDRANAFDDEMTASLHEALEACERNGTRCIVLTGAGRNFCAGQDLSAFLERHRSETPVSVRDHVLRGYNRIVRQIRNLEMPVIAAVNGAVAGAGLGLACACDLRFAGESARFRTAFIGIGLVPDSAVSFHLPRLIGYGRALDMALTNQLIDAATALQYGLVTRVFADAELRARTIDTAGTLAKGPTKAMGFTKQVFQRSIQSGLDDALDYEACMQQLARDTADHTEGVKAFLEKRPAEYKGR